MIIDVMKARRSVRRFQSDPPDRELIESLIEAAITAPSASNRQPWRFLAVTNRTVIETMADAVEKGVERIAGHIVPSLAPVFRSYGDYFTRFREAPVVIVPLFRSSTLLTNLVDEDLPEEDRGRIEWLEEVSGVIGTSLAVQNLLLAAHELGLGASGMTGPLVAADRIADILAVPLSWRVLALVPVGFPDESPAPPGRKEVGRVLKWVD